MEEEHNETVGALEKSKKDYEELEGAFTEERSKVEAKDQIISENIETIN